MLLFLRRPPQASDRSACRRQPTWGILSWIGRWLVISGTLMSFGVARLAALDPRRKPDSYSIYTWSIDRGLPSDKIRAITQTRDGYLWLATAHGLARFDGYEFTSFTSATNPELRGGGFFAVLEAPDGTLWAGGDNGLFRWRGGRFEQLTTADGLPNNYVRALALTHDGALVVCTRTGYCFVRDGKIVTPEGVWKQIRGVTRSYAEERDGSQLLGTDEGLWRISGTTIERLSGRDGLPHRAFVTLATTPDGSVWIGHSTGLRQLKPDGTKKDFGVADGLTNPRVASVCADHDGNLWVATADGLYRLTSDRLEPAHFASLKGAGLQQLYEDREGALWIAAAPGLFRIEDNTATSIGEAEGLAQTAVYAVCEARDGAWWIGLWNGGVYRYDRKHAVRVALAANPMPEQVLALAEEADGTMWIGAMTGLYRHNAVGTENLYRSDRAATWLEMLAQHADAVIPGIAHSRVNSIAIGGEGEVWVGTDGALYHSESGGFRAYTAAQGLPGNVIKSVLRTHDGDIWIAAPPRGVARLHEGQWTSFWAGKELAKVYPRTLYEDSAGAIWVTTDGGGINRLRDGQWRVFTTRDGLADDFISSVVEDKAGNIWLAFPRGVMRLARDELNAFESNQVAKLRPRVFGRSDGLPAGEPNQQGSPSAWRARDGRLLFATDRGVAVVEPDHLTNNRVPPPIYIERIEVNGIAVDLTRPVVVAPGSNDVEIHYTAIETLAPENVRFRIKLAPLDGDWVDTGARRDVRYAKLPPGHYRFSVAATNNAGIWSDVDAAIAFEVQPFFYETRWFAASVIVIGATTVVLVFWLRSRLARQRMQTLERLVDERTHALREATRTAEAAVVAKTGMIAALKESEEETARERARFKFIFDVVPIGLAWMIRGDASSRIVNAAFAEITGVPMGRCGEPGVLHAATHPDDREASEALDRQLLAGAIDRYTVEKRFVHADRSVRWGVFTLHVYRDGVDGRIQEVSTLIDITMRKETEAKLDETNKELFETSRRAGMAEVATGVLHNVGNVLNSVNVSVWVLADSVRGSKIDRVAKLSQLLQENAADLAAFIGTDPRGQRIPAFVDALASHLAQERTSLLKEIEALQRNVEHIKQVVAMQQSYARVAGVVENTSVAELIDDAIRINAAALERHRVRLVRDYDARASIMTERHRVIQILVNLIQNAKFACQESDRLDRAIVIRVGRENGRVKISVCDNGVGIPPENLTRVFSHGFTTRRNGHGFGLHSGALAARELGGSLAAQSDGIGCGATFILELPEQRDESAT